VLLGHHGPVDTIKTGRLRRIQCEAQAMVVEVGGVQRALHNHRQIIDCQCCRAPSYSMLSGEDGQNQRCHKLPYRDSILVVWGHEESRVSCTASSYSVAPTNGKWCNRLISTTSGARGAGDGIRASSGAVWE
jgi:hypothetical protein